MESARSYSSVSTRKLSISIKQGWLTSNGDSSSYQLDNKKNPEDKEDALARLKNAQTSNYGRIKSTGSMSDLRSVSSVKQQFVLYLWSMFFGKDKASDLAEQMGFENPYSMEESTTESEGFATITIQGNEEYYYSELEEMSFSSTGIVTTADGRTIQFGIGVTMSREFTQYYRQEGIPITAFCDPLVINLDSNFTQMEDQKFFFDLDSDGIEEEISQLGSGSGFLSLDQNGDGIINDGSELFGTKSGDGFADLSEYDEDGNGWIDENDSIYQKLKIWVKDAQGNDILYSLKDKNVGAIYLGNHDTDFTLRSATTGDVNGAIRKTGIFLYENGIAGTMNHLDIAN